MRYRITVNLVIANITKAASVDGFTPLASLFGILIVLNQNQNEMRRALVVFACMLAFAQSRGQVGCSPFGDLNGDSLVTIIDLMSLLGVYGVDYTTQTPGQECQPVTWNGYTYDVVQIGEQCWFAENLRTQLYQNGDSIVNDPELCPNPNGTHCYNQLNNQWSEVCYGCGMSTVPVQDSWWGIEEELEMEDIYGRFYNEAAANDPRGLCPSGWSVPRAADFNYVCGLYGNQSGTLPDDGLLIEGTGGWFWQNGTELPECAMNLSGLGLRMGGYSGSAFPDVYAIGRTGAYWYNGINEEEYGQGYTSMLIHWSTYECPSCFSSSINDFPYSGAYIRCIKD